MLTGSKVQKHRTKNPVGCMPQTLEKPREILCCQILPNANTECLLNYSTLVAPHVSWPMELDGWMGLTAERQSSIHACRTSRQDAGRVVESSNEVEANVDSHTERNVCLDADLGCRSKALHQKNCCCHSVCV